VQKRVNVQSLASQLSVTPRRKTETNWLLQVGISETVVCFGSLPSTGPVVDLALNAYASVLLRETKRRVTKLIQAASGTLAWGRVAALLEQGMRCAR